MTTIYEPLPGPLCPSDPLGHNTRGAGPDGIARCDYCGTPMFRERWVEPPSARRVMLALHKVLGDAVERGDLWYVGRDGPREANQFIVWFDKDTRAHVVVRFDA